ncbi:MAG TPA: hypothetical protein VNX25_03505 [Verrucomicrobiae bacterium]|nr:hypothetical protein [Verrucomicrobiae bacterium]
MRDTSSEWCFEGGCTYDLDVTLEDELDTEELECLYAESCVASSD